MTLLWILLIPLIAGVLAWASERVDKSWPRWISLAAVAGDLALVAGLWINNASTLTLAGQNVWIASLNHPWIPSLGASFHLAVDGLSLILLALTMFLGVCSVLCSWTEIEERVGFFHFNLMWILSGIAGVFMAMDLFLFYFFWELMLIPMYFLIVLWGHENRLYAAIKFFIFTQASGLLMFLAILGLYWVHGNSTGAFTFDYFKLLGTQIPAGMSVWLMLGFFIAFAVKLPMVPFHNWLPDAHTEAPTAGSVILAGLLLKTGGYGLLRFVLPLFPDASRAFAPFAMALAVAGILYGAVVAIGQSDLKRLIAYTSVSHLGFVLLGVYSFNELAGQGVVMQMVSHGISTGALFVLVGGLQERIHTRDLRRMGGLWTTAPRMGTMAVIFAMASLGLPGMGNFVAEFLTLLGSYRASPSLTAWATLGLVAATIYSLWILQRAFFGPERKDLHVRDFGARDMAVMSALVVVILWLGLFPQTVLNASRSSIKSLDGPRPAAGVSLSFAPPAGPIPREAKS